MTTSPENAHSKQTRAFVYVDPYKLYSFSSQLFSGLTDSIIQRTHVASEQSEEQKGPVGSGRVLADIAAHQTGTEERRFLFDYAYTLMERELTERGALIEVTPKSSPGLDELRAARFVKVTGATSFQDADGIAGLLRDFNKMVDYVAHLSTFQARVAALAELKDKLEQVHDKQKRKAIEAQALARLNRPPVEKQDEKQMEGMAFLLSRGFGDRFEVHLRPNGRDSELVFSAILEPSNMRDTVRTLLAKYSRLPQNDFTIVGVVSHVGKRQPAPSYAGAPTTLGQALRQMSGQVQALDDWFSGPTEQEVSVDPIAVYREI